MKNSPEKHPRKQRPRRFSDQQAFELWQKYMTDAEIAKALGVCRSRIQAWRDVMELPSTARARVDTKKYHLTKMRDGTVAILCESAEL